MSDEEGSVTPVETPITPPLTDAPATPVAEPEVSSYFDKDGTLKEGWKNCIPEDFRGRKVFDTVSDFQGLLKQLGNKDVLISRQGKGVMAPPADATQTEKDMYFDALGRPKTPADYKTQIPKEREAVYDKSAIADFNVAAHNAGLTEAQHKAVFDYYDKYVVGAIEAQQRNAAESVKADETELQRRLGPDAFNGRMEMARKLLEDNVDVEDKQAVDAAIGHNPAVLNFLAKIGQKFMEGKLPSQEAAGAQTKLEMRNRAKELMESPGYIERSLPQATLQRLDREINELYKKVGNE